MLSFQYIGKTVAYQVLAKKRAWNRIDYERDWKLAKIADVSLCGAMLWGLDEDGEKIAVDTADVVRVFGMS